MPLLCWSMLLACAVALFLLESVLLS